MPCQCMSVHVRACEYHVREIMPRTCTDVPRTFSLAQVKRLSLSRKLSFVNSVKHHVLSGDEAGFSVSEDSFSEPHYHDESFNVDVDTDFLSDLRTEAQSPSPRFETGDTTRSHAGTNGNLRFRVKRSSSKEAESSWYSDH